MTKKSSKKSAVRRHVSVRPPPKRFKAAKKARKVSKKKK
jgi:hypothetical protein